VGIYFALIVLNGGRRENATPKSAYNASK